MNLRIYIIFLPWQLGFHPKFHVLDIDNIESIRMFKKFISDTYKGIDVLVNNAAIAFKVSYIIYSNYVIWESINNCNLRLLPRSTQPSHLLYKPGKPSRRIISVFWMCAKNFSHYCVHMLEWWMCQVLVDIWLKYLRNNCEIHLLPPLLLKPSLLDLLIRLSSKHYFLIYPLLLLKLVKNK